MGVEACILSDNDVFWIRPDLQRLFIHFCDPFFLKLSISFFILSLTLSCLAVITHCMNRESRRPASHPLSAVATRLIPCFGDRPLLDLHRQEASKIVADSDQWMMICIPSWRSQSLNKSRSRDQRCCYHGYQGFTSINMFAACERASPRSRERLCDPWRIFPLLPEALRGPSRVASMPARMHNDM